MKGLVKVVVEVVGMRGLGNAEFVMKTAKNAMCFQRDAHLAMTIRT